MSGAGKSDSLKGILAPAGNGQLGTGLRRHVWLDGCAVTAIDIDELDLRDTATMVAEAHDG